MTLVLRQRHRRIFAALVIFLPVALVVSVATRKSVPLVAALPKGLASAAGRFGVTVCERIDLFPKVPVRVRLLRESATGGLALDLAAAKVFVKPDLLVYWSAGSVAVTDRIPGDARLLGTFSGEALKLPVEAAISEGSLLLYSLANQKIVDVSGRMRFNPLTK